MKVPQSAVAGRPACSNPRHILMKGVFQIMTRYVVKRILLAIVSVLVICAITFFAMNAIPGGPFNSEKALSEATKAVLMERYNLISGTLFSCFKVSARLGATAAVCAVACGIVLGSLAALFRNRLIDRVIVFFTTLFTAMPSFVFATFLMLVFCITLKWLPVWDASNKSLILPVIALMAYPMAYVTRLTKTSMLDSLGQDYIRTARAKGVPMVKVIFKHALRNALIPVITYVGPMLAYILTGSLVVENIFTIGGLGQQFVKSISNRDYPMIMATTIFLAVVMVICNLLSDIAYKIVDPRITLD